MFYNQLFYDICILSFVSFISIDADCGCSKVRRSEIEIVKRDTSPEKSADNVDQRRECDGETMGRSSLLESMHENMALIPGGVYTIGTNNPIFKEDHEAPERTIQMNAFYIDQYEASNADFKEFVDSTGYTTYAERFGDSFVFKNLISEPVQEAYNDYRVASAPWWYKVNKTNWLHPEGDGSSIDDRMDHPVVHVSWFDATEYCKWRKKRLPTEIEWEVACRGGKKGKLYAWGNKLNAKDKHWLNIWQGEFPHTNTEEDGYPSTCPVNEFRQNDYGLYNILGNVWEWTETFWNPGDAERSNLNLDNVERVKKGGSYLCHEAYCYRYRCAARSQNTADSSAGNLGFRCAHS